MAELARRTGGDRHLLAGAGRPGRRRATATRSTDADRLAAEGLRVVPQVSSRPTGMLFGLQSSLHPFITHPTYRRSPTCRWRSRVAQLRQPEVRAALLAEQPDTNERDRRRAR